MYCEVGSTSEARRPLSAEADAFAALAQFSPSTPIDEDLQHLANIDATHQDGIDGGCPEIIQQNVGLGHHPARRLGSHAPAALRAPRKRFAGLDAGLNSFRSEGFAESARRPQAKPGGAAARASAPAGADRSRAL